tara:strand:+ start:236 stop:1009 length:774 start_codon:yes stop_codon:yes gene_type:complete
MSIHHTAVIDSGAELENGVSVGPFSIIGAKVKVGRNTEIGSHVRIEPGVVVGKNCRVFHNASLGGEPQIVGFDPKTPSSTKIGDGTTIREYVTVHRSGFENGVTQIGKHCLLMAYTHVAHDCKLGDHVIIVNYTGLPGHVVVENSAFISGLVGIHQFARIGKHSMVGGMAAVRKDVLPFSIVEGYPARLVGPNSIGLRRSGFSKESRSILKQALTIIKDPELNTSQALEKIENGIAITEEISYLIDFVRKSSRGVTK